MIYIFLGAFYHTEHDPTNKKVYMHLRGILAKIMAEVNPSLYQKYVTTDKNRSWGYFIGVILVV